MAKFVGYDSQTQTLEIEFLSGEVWQYHDVAAPTYEEMMQGSIGKFFQDHIKNRYRETRIR